MELKLDEEIVKKVLADYGLSLEDVLYASKKKPVAEQDWIYLIHHMHQPDNVEEMEILHHCEMYEKKNLKGKKYYQKHVKDGKLIQHVLDIKEDKLDDAPKVVYDHLNNGFKIKLMEIDKKKYAVIFGLVSAKETKWSDMDKGGAL